VAFYPAHGMTAEQLLAEADRRMYVAKQNQREMLKAQCEDADLEEQLPLTFELRTERAS